MFLTNQATPERFASLIDLCAQKRDIMEAPAWKQYINDVIYQESIILGSSDQQIAASPYSAYGKSHDISTTFPYGLYFGSRIKDFRTNRIGCVIGFVDNNIVIAFENSLTPTIVQADTLSFKNGQYALV